MHFMQIKHLVGKKLQIRLWVASELNELYKQIKKCMMGLEKEVNQVALEYLNFEVVTVCIFPWLSITFNDLSYLDAAIRIVLPI